MRLHPRGGGVKRGLHGAGVLDVLLRVVDPGARHTGVGAAPMHDGWSRAVRAHADRCHRLPVAWNGAAIA
jgi:hypothetical protein